MKFVAYVVSAVIGALIGHYLLEGAPAAYASILISYHLFLAYLVVSASHEKGLSMPLAMTLLTHLAFLALLVGMAYARTHIPFFGVIRWLVPGLAVFETKWLFSGQDRVIKPVEVEEPHGPIEGTVEDHEAFREHLHEPVRPFRKSGRSIDEEFKLWLADRYKKRALAAAAAAAESANAGGSAAGGASDT